MSWLGRTPCTPARSLMRSAAASNDKTLGASAMAIAIRLRARWVPRLGEAAVRSRVGTWGLGLNIALAMGSEWQHRLEHACQPAHGVGLVDGAGAAVLQPRVGDLRRRHDVAGENRRRIDDAGQADELGTGVDADLLFSADQQVPVRQHVDDGDG